MHGEERIDLPALPELMNVLWEMNICPDLEMLEARRSEAARDRETALQFLRHMLFVRPGTEKDRRLRKAMDEMASETPDGLIVGGSRPRRQGLISWTPE